MSSALERRIEALEAVSAVEAVQVTAESLHEVADTIRAGGQPPAGWARLFSNDQLLRMDELQGEP